MSTQNEVKNMVEKTCIVSVNTQIIMNRLLVGICALKISVRDQKKMRNVFLETGKKVFIV